MLIDILGFVAIFLLSWLGIGCGMIYVYNIFKFQRPFSKIMVEKGIYDQKTHGSIMTSSWVGAAVTLGGSLAVVVWLDVLNGFMGVIMTVLGIFVGLLRSRHIVGFNRSNVTRFARTHMICMDRKKAAAYLQAEYGIRLDGFPK